MIRLQDAKAHLIERGYRPSDADPNSVVALGTRLTLEQVGERVQVHRRGLRGTTTTSYASLAHFKAAYAMAVGKRRGRP